MKKLLLMALAVLCLGQTPFGRGPYDGRGVYRNFGERRLGRVKLGRVPQSGPTFEYYPGNAALEAGIAALEPLLTIPGTGVSVAPKVRYKFDLASGNLDPWVYGSTLIATTAGGLVYQDGSPLLGSFDDSILFDDVGYFLGAVGTNLNAGTDDIIFELVAKVPASGNKEIILTSSNGIEFVQIHLSTDRKLTVKLDDGPTLKEVVSGAIDEGAWFHGIAFCDVSGSGQIYINGVASGAAVSLAALGALDPDDRIGLASRVGGAFGVSSNLAYVAMWHAPGYLDTHLQAAVAAERFAKLTGTFARIGEESQVPIVATRPSSAYLRKEVSSVSKLFLVHDNWMRIDQVSAITGYHSELARTNSILQSEDISTSWTEKDSGDTQSLNAIDFVNGETVADGNIADATDGDHGFTQVVTLTAGTWLWSVFPVAGDQTHVYLSNDTVANVTGYFQISDCSEGTIGAGVLFSIAEDYGGGRCRFTIAFTGTAAPHTLAMQTAEADNDKIFAGDGATVNTYFAGMMLEKGGDLSSYIATTTIAVTRAVDLMRFDGLANIGGVGSNREGSATVSFSLPDKDLSEGLIYRMATLNDGGANADAVTFESEAATGFFRIVSDSAEGAARVATGTTDGQTGTRQETHFVWQEDLLELYLGGILEGTSTSSFTAPDDLDQIHVGMSNPSLHQGATIERLRIFPAPRGP